MNASSSLCSKRLSIYDALVGCPSDKVLAVGVEALFTGHLSVFSVHSETDWRLGRLLNFRTVKASWLRMNKTQRRRSVLRGGMGADLPLSHSNTHTQTFQNTLCVFRWHKQSSQCLVCPQSICDEMHQLAIVQATLLRCFLLVLQSSECKKCNVRSEVADVTGIVKYIRKSVFRYQNV